MEIKLNVTGMSCGHCVSTISNGLGALEGVAGVDVSLEKGLVTVQTNSDKITPELLISNLDELGFDGTAA